MPGMAAQEAVHVHAHAHVHLGTWNNPAGSRTDRIMRAACLENLSWASWLAADPAAGWFCISSSVNLGGRQGGGRQRGRGHIPSKGQKSVRAVFLRSCVDQPKPCTSPCVCDCPPQLSQCVYCNRGLDLQQRTATLTHPHTHLSRSVAATASAVRRPALYSSRARAPLTPVISVRASTCIGVLGQDHAAAAPHPSQRPDYAHSWISTTRLGLSAYSFLSGKHLLRLSLATETPTIPMAAVSVRPRPKLPQQEPHSPLGAHPKKSAAGARPRPKLPQQQTHSPLGARQRRRAAGTW